MQRRYCIFNHDEMNIYFQGIEINLIHIVHEFDNIIRDQIQMILSKYLSNNYLGQLIGNIVNNQGI
jgi:hypothetical protein